MSNPYEPPKAPIALTPVAGTGEDVCPKCNSPNVRKPSFTFWGGAIGPRLLNHRICNSCGFGFNGKTGKSNMGAIITYQVVIFAILFVIYFVVYSSK